MRLLLKILFLFLLLTTSVFAGNLGGKTVKDIKEANVKIVNYTRGCEASGTHIKINKQSYILTVAHIIEDYKDNAIIKMDDGKKYDIQIVKIDKTNDLMLCWIANLDNACLEISNKDIEEGDQTILIGNPDMEIDIFTNGIVAQVKEEYYLITNKCYFGNSGGACLSMDGKIVGVLSQFLVLNDYRYNLAFGRCINLKNIKEFLKDIKE